MAPYNNNNFDLNFGGRNNANLTGTNLYDGLSADNDAFSLGNLNTNWNPGGEGGGIFGNMWDSMKGGLGKFGTGLNTMGGGSMLEAGDAPTGLQKFFGYNTPEGSVGGAGVNVGKGALALGNFAMNMSNFFDQKGYMSDLMKMKKKEFKTKLWDLDNQRQSRNARIAANKSGMPMAEQLDFKKKYTA